MSVNRIYYRVRNKLFLNHRPSPYFSQDGQDKYIHQKFFESVKDGFFVDIGANDGITLSNTYFFEKKLGWNGICVEPNPDTFKELQRIRKCTVLNAAISNHSNSATFLKISGPSEMLSGLIDFYDEKHLMRMNDEIKSNGGKKEEILVQCYRFNDLLKSHKVDKIDYLSIDTEGGEFSIVEAIDFSQVPITVISIENPYNDQRIPNLLMSNKFKLINVLGSDEIYINTKRLT